MAKGVFPGAAEKICKDIRHAVEPFVGDVGLGVCLSSPAWTAGRTRALKAVAERSHFGDLDVPKCITSTATLRSDLDSSASCWLPEPSLAGANHAMRFAFLTFLQRQHNHYGKALL